MTENTGDIPEIPVPPAAAEPFEIAPAHGVATEWHKLTESQKLDALNQKVDILMTQIDWIGTNFSGILDMASKLNMGMVGKMMGFGGKNNG